VHFVDTHCHINFDAFDSDRGDVLDRAEQAGVARVLNPAIDIVSSQQILAMVDEYPILSAAVGVHPNDAQTWGVDSKRQLAELAQHVSVVAIGEIGLDFYRDRAPKQLQLKIFREQLELAALLSLPVIIHNRQAEHVVMEVLMEWYADLQRMSSSLLGRPGVLHSFSGSGLMAYQMINLNFYIGITGPVTFRNADPLRGIVGKVPIDRILIETDAPFLAPHPHRGMRNEPAFVRLIADKIAEIHSISLDAVAVQTSDNARRLFNW
jgi:TatD DNase family protein